MQYEHTELVDGLEVLHHIEGFRQPTGVHSLGVVNLGRHLDPLGLNALDEGDALFHIDL